MWSLPKCYIATRELILGTKLSKKTCPVILCPREPPTERLGCGESDEVSEPIQIENKCLYVTLNRRLNYIGISTLEGPTRFFAQDPDKATNFINEYDDKGAKKFIEEYDGCGFW